MTTRDSTSGASGLYAFEVVLHRRPAEAAVVDMHVDAHGTWPILAVSRDDLTHPFAIGFDAAVERLARLPRMFVELDGSFVWASPAADRAWQVDGNVFERSGRVLLVDLKGSCPPPEFDRLLSAFGWPEEPVMLGLVRAAVFLDEPTFRRHASARGDAGDGQTLRPR